LQAVEAALPNEGATVEADLAPVQTRILPGEISGASKTEATDLKTAAVENSEVLEGVPAQKLPNRVEPTQGFKDDATGSMRVSKAEEVHGNASIVAEDLQTDLEKVGPQPRIEAADPSEPSVSAVARDSALDKQPVIDTKTGLPGARVDSTQAQPISAEQTDGAAMQGDTTPVLQKLKAVASSVTGPSVAGPSSQPAESKLASPPVSRKSENVSAPAPSDVSRNTTSAASSSQKCLSDEKARDLHANTTTTTPSVSIAPPPAGPTIVDTATGPVLAKSSSGTMPERPGQSNAAPMPHDSAGMPALADDKTSVPVSSAVHDVRLLDRAGQAEMHIGLRTAAFGGIEVHAVVRESQVGLTIGSERGDLHHLFANEVPGIAGRLQQHDLRLDSVKFFDQGLTFDAGTWSGSNPRPRTFSQDRLPLAEAEPAGEVAVTASDPEILFEARSGINVRA